MSSTLPSHARVVIVGGGIIGLSVAYHLAKRGCRDVLLLERKQFTCGTTWHAAGLVTQLRATENMSRLAVYTADLFRNLGRETGQETGYRQCGSLTVATMPARLEELQRGAAMGRNFGLDVEMVSPLRALELMPYLDAADVLGAAWIPSDGKTNPIDTARAFAAGARQNGARLIEGVRVTGVQQRNGRVATVETDAGTVHCETAVLCCGMWTRELAASIGVAVPLHAAEHFYAVTESIPGLSADLPVLRDLDGRIYVKEDAGKLLVGCFEAEGKPWGMEGIPPDFCFDQLPDDLGHFGPYLENAIRRLPVLGGTGIQLFFNGPESFTPDDRFLMGETAEVSGLHVACGFNSCGIESSGGAGKVMADWILDGHPGADYWDVDIRRAMPFQRNRRYLKARIAEIMGTLYGMHWPLHVPESARGVRRSPLHERLAAAGASFGEAAGYERPLWFGAPGAINSPEYSFQRQNWFAHVAAECRTTREAVALFDQSSFQHLLVQGRDALPLLERLSCGRIDVPPGKVVYTPWLNDRGGFESDLTITRLAEDRFVIVTTAVQKMRDLAWLQRHGAGFEHVFITDVAAGYATLSVMGPRSRELLSRVSPDDFSDAAFPFGTARLIEIGLGQALAQRMTFVGEVGWELHIAADMAASIFDSLAAAGEPLGLRLAGYHALDSLRLECGYRDWGLEISDEDTPLEAGLGFAVCWEKAGGFFGRDTLAAGRGKPLHKRLVQVRVDDAQPLVYGAEPLWRDGIRAGYLKSGGFGHTLSRPIGMGYVRSAGGITPEWLAGGKWEVEIAGERYPATVQLPAFLPNVARGGSR